MTYSILRDGITPAEALDELDEEDERCESGVMRVAARHEPCDDTFDVESFVAMSGSEPPPPPPPPSPSLAEEP